MFYSHVRFLAFRNFLAGILPQFLEILAGIQIPNLLGFAWITNNLDVSCFTPMFDFWVM